MALHKSELTMGSTPTETVLWTNSSPTSAFNQQYIEKTKLPSFDQLKITFRISISNSNTKSVILDMSEFLKSYPYFAAYYWGSDGTGARMFVRPFYSTNSGIRVQFSNCTKAYTNVYENANEYLIPIEIIGIKF